MSIPYIPRYSELEEILSQAKRMWGKYTLEKALGRFDRIHESLNNPSLADFLCWKYGKYPILKRAGMHYPVAVYPASRLQQRDLESVISKPLQETIPDPKTFVANDATYRVLASKIKLHLTNRLTYTMMNLQTSPELKLNCQLGYYYYCLDTCFSLYWELLSKFEGFRGKGDVDFEKIDKKLPLRNRLHSSVEDPVTNGKGRSVAIGITTLIAFNDEGTTKLWVKRRSSRGVAVFPAGISGIPSGMFQPLMGHLKGEYSIRNSILREYLEEAFDMPEGSGEESFNYFYGDPRLMRLTSMIGTGQAEPFLTGVSVDLLSLRPEICTLLWIKSSEWFSHHSVNAPPGEAFKLNFEFEPRKIDSENPREIVVPVEYSSNDEELLEQAYLSPRQMTPAGASAFWLGVDKLRELLR